MLKLLSVLLCVASAFAEGPGTLYVQLTYARGGAVPNANILIVPVSSGDMSRQAQWTSTDMIGIRRIELPPGRYNVFIPSRDDSVRPACEVVEIVSGETTKLYKQLSEVLMEDPIPSQSYPVETIGSPLEWTLPPKPSSAHRKKH